MDPVIERISAAEHMEIEAISDAEPTGNRERTPIEGTSPAAEHTKTGEMVFNVTSAAAESTESGERTQWPKNSIFRSPAHIRSGRESNFEPKLVSIGPYYHGRKDLKLMEDLKHRCISEFQEKLAAASVRNSPRPSEAGFPHRQNLSIYNVPVDPSTQAKWGIGDVPLHAFMEWEEHARAYYKQEFDHSPLNFVAMLVLDSCFIIRTIFSLSQQVQESMAFLDVHIKEIRSDLLLLENQIPLFFIKEVYEWLFPCLDENPPFNTVLEQFICLDMPWRINDHGMSSEAVHLLDLYWRCSLSPQMYMKLSKLETDLFERGDLSEQEQASLAEIIHLSNNAPMEIANATELHKIAGIEFEKFKDKGHLDVIFSNGVMWMPRLKIDSRQTILLVNLIAFENCILHSMRTFSCYMKLMDALIDSKKDVKLLQKCGVIYNTLSNHEMAATFFNDIGNFCFIDYKTNHFSSLYKDVQEYYDSSWHRRSVSLRQNYFSSPWAVISVIAAAILLFFSAIQTLFTVLGYFYPKN